MKKLQREWSNAEDITLKGKVQFATFTLGAVNSMKEVNEVIAASNQNSQFGKLVQPAVYDDYLYFTKKEDIDLDFEDAPLTDIKGITNKVSKACQLLGKKNICKCSKSGCLKKYCQCLRMYEYCSPETCGCEGCFNIKDYEQARQNAISAMKSS